MEHDLKEHSHSLPQLVAQSLHNDPRIAQAKHLLMEAVKEHQKQLTDTRPPIASLKQSYAELLAAFTEYRGAKLWFPFLGSGIGNGALVELADGSVKYDFISGIGTHYWGHSHLDLINSSVDAAISDTIMQGHLQQNVDSVELSKLLLQASKLDHCLLTTSGAMANENALKIAFQKNYPANRILAFERCFVGRTLAIAQITDKAAFREGLPSTLLVDYVPYFDCTRPQESTEEALRVLKKYLNRYPGGYAAMCFEFVQGEAGFYQGTADFFKAIMTLLKSHNVAIFADEVQTFGRLPELFAFQYYGLEEWVDIATIGKLSQVCATLFRKHYLPRPGLISQTFTGSTSAIKAGRVILNSLVHEGYFGKEGKIIKLHRHFVAHLERLSHQYPDLIEGPFGIGCMIAFTPYKGEAAKVIAFIHRLFEAGVLSFMAGSNPTRVRFLIPAGAVTHEDIDRVAAIIEQTLLFEEKKESLP